MKKRADTCLIIGSFTVFLLIGLKIADASSSIEKVFTNSIGIKFVLIPAGTFMMGSPVDEPARKQDELQHKVTLSKPFYLQTTEITQGQWKRIMGNNPSAFKNCGDDCPVSMVSWFDTQEFIKKLNEMEKTNKYRLPTEAEWEYACRAGTSTTFFTGKCISADQANFDGNHPLPGCPKGQYRETPLRVASFSPNAWGLYDMHGSLWEWCQDWFDNYPAEAVIDPKGPASGDAKVVRGGSWNHFAMFMRSAFRGAEVPDGEHCIGFRLVYVP